MGNNTHSKLPWAELPFFLAVAQHKTLSGAAKALKIDRTTVARRIETLKESVEQPLFNRSAGTFELTLFGRQLLAATERAEDELSLINSLTSSTRHSRGTVHLTLSEHLLVFLKNALANFVTEHPDTLLKISSTDHYSSLKNYEADVALRFSKHAPNDLYAHKIATINYKLYQAKSQKNSVLGIINIPHQSGVPDPILKFYPTAQLNMSVDGVLPIREMIATGVGAGILPTFLGDADERLQACSPTITSYQRNLFTVCLHEQKNTYRIKNLMRYFEHTITEIF